MKISWKHLWLITLLKLSLISSAFSSEKIDLILTKSYEKKLDSLEGKKEELEEVINQFDSMEHHLQKTIRGQSVYLQYEIIAGSAIVIGIVIAGYKDYFPPGYRAMLSAYLSVKTMKRGMVRLNETEVIALAEKISFLKNQIKESQNSLSLQIKRYCTRATYHNLCD